MTTNISISFAREFELYKSHTSFDHHSSSSVSEYSRVSLQNAKRLRAFLYRELWATELERMTSHLWIMSTQSSTNISSLHQQKIKDREIIVTKNSRLHLVWIYNRIFIKSLLQYLLSYHFWFEFLSREDSILEGSAQEQEVHARIQKSALDLLRFYYHLIQHESDFQIACENERLLSSDISWLDFCVFSKAFSEICDDAVSKRYHYKELKLTRLNLYAKLLLGKF